MKTLQSRVVLDGLIFPEGIRWYQGKVWFSDILACKVATLTPEGKSETVAQLKDHPSGLGFLPDGRLLIATQDERLLLRLDPDGIKIVADLKDMPSSHLNDMVVDGQGRAYLDNRFDGIPEPRGSLVMVKPDGKARIVADKLQSPNGLTISPDGKRLVLCELAGNKLTAFDILPDGSLTNRRLFADLGDASPDGICQDAEGAVWVGLPFKGEFRRVREGGEVTHRIVYKDRWGVAPVLGGQDRRTLFLCTAQVTLEDLLRAKRDPAALKKCKGWIEKVDGIEVPGAGWP